LDSDSIGAVEADISLIVVGDSGPAQLLSVLACRRRRRRLISKWTQDLQAAAEFVAHRPSPSRSVWRIIISLNPPVRHGCLPSSAIST